MRSNAPKNENPATPATAPALAPALDVPGATDSPEGIGPSAAPDLATLPQAQPQRPDYPIAWLFPSGVPIPRPYRNAPPRPDIGFFNNPLRW